ncbi:hypothetical protein J7T55_012360 [Diaporthe amygdali]|uniref:uncharacterized protein n=1 Tax=Phomopsis amygdali TaxID=1214568 RepID=UPI0022FE7F43|nr:uncharacterized protein J7T55_012360 [Diaporthe amygdali]KAJ0123889.1 hypothetical protein J7T55_012360 [Diaporthe amygdali]
MQRSKRVTNPSSLGISLIETIYEEALPTQLKAPRLRNSSHTGHVQRKVYMIAVRLARADGLTITLAVGKTGMTMTDIHCGVLIELINNPINTDAIGSLEKIGGSTSSQVMHLPHSSSPIDSSQFQSLLLTDERTSI